MLNFKQIYFYCIWWFPSSRIFQITRSMYFFLFLLALTIALTIFYLIFILFLLQNFYNPGHNILAIYCFMLVWFTTSKARISSIINFVYELPQKLPNNFFLLLFLQMNVMHYNLMFLTILLHFFLSAHKCSKSPAKSGMLSQLMFASLFRKTCLT